MAMDHRDEAIITGTPIVEIWDGEMVSGDDKLLMLSDLSKQLKARNIIERSPQALYRWSVQGFRAKDTGQRVRLRTHMVGRYMHSSVRWVKEFLAYQESAGSSS